MRTLIRLRVLLFILGASALGAEPVDPPSVARIAAEYRRLTPMTKGAVEINPELAMLCRGASKAEIEAARTRFGPHAYASVRIFMNDRAATAFLAKAAQFPVGAVIVKQKDVYGSIDETGKPVTGHDGVGGMIKRAPGFDPAHGDWEYFYFEKPEKIESGRIASCIQCHAAAKAKDYVFGGWRKPEP